MSDQARADAAADARTSSSADTRASAPRRKRRLWRRAFVLLLGVLLLAQLPFVFRRFELNNLRRALDHINARRVEHADERFREYVGVAHVHTALGGHSTGTLADVVTAARAERLDFVVMTEHTEADYDTAAQTLSGKHGGTIFLAGNETQAQDGGRFLVLPGAAETRDAGALPSSEFAAREREAGRSIFVAYPEEFKAWDAGDYDGVEVYNLFTDARRASKFALLFDSLWMIGGESELLFARFFRRPDEALRRWDRLATQRMKRSLPTPALGGVDAHANVGAHLRLASGERLFGVQLDPYERSFRIVRQHVLLPQGEQLTPATLLAALREGRSFIAFDAFADARGFRFTAADADGMEHASGEQVRLAGGLRLRISTPLESRIVLIRNGEQVAESQGTEVDFPAREAGAYRVEVYLTGVPLLEGKPWIISNHIYLGGADTTTPRQEENSSQTGASR